MSHSSTAEHEFSEDGIRRIHLNYPKDLIAQKRTEWQGFTKNLKPYPDTFDGKGIVICAGGFAYLTCAWVNIKCLRKKGCKLPIELWHQDGELSRETIAELGKLGVTCRNFADYSQERIRNGYQLKPVAILHSSFREILFLDADNNCLRDPAFLFEHPQYKSTGAVFWPDYWKTEKSNPIWELVDSREYEIPEQESGQILINKEKCWHALNLCLFFNLDPFYYKILWGDKDTFKFSWMALERPFHMIEKGVAAVGFRQEGFGFGAVAMLQHDFSGKPVFVHSNLLKWHERNSRERFWREIRRPRAEEKIGFRYHPQFNKDFLRIEGDVEMISAKEGIAELEQESIAELEDLRKAQFYVDLMKSAGSLSG